MKIDLNDSAGNTRCFVVKGKEGRERGLDLDAGNGKKKKQGALMRIAKATLLYGQTIAYLKFVMLNLILNLFPEAIKF